MDKFSSTGNGLFMVSINILVFVFSVSAQSGFLNIDCGGKKNHTDSETNMTWTVDTNYIDVGEVANVSTANQTISDDLKSLRFFPSPLTKSCYRLPLKSNVPHLLRLWFLFGNYNGVRNLPSFNFSIETEDMLFHESPSFISAQDNAKSEYIFTSSGNVLYVCFIRTSDNNDPFISAIELRSNITGMYNQQAQPGKIMKSILRYDIGAESSHPIRYPQDPFDRIWKSDILITPYWNRKKSSRKNASYENSTNGNFPPAVVLQTAAVASWLGYNLDKQNTSSLVILYFAEIHNLNASGSRKFDVLINDRRVANIKLSRQNYSMKLLIPYNDTKAPTVNIALQKTAEGGKNSLNPLLNAVEYYGIYDSEPLTYVSDVQGLLSMKEAYVINKWISDPCFRVEWNGVKCDKGRPVRVSEIDLSGWNLSGFIPQDISQLTGLTSISLQNNHLSGSLPDLCGITKLRILRIQNNNLTGTIPDCLSRLINLEELNIENNNFRGVIPESLLKKGINLRYSGNLNLCNGTFHCYSREKKSKIPLISALGAVLAVLLVLILGYAYHRRYRKAHPSLSVNVPNPESCRQFSGLELKTATKNFSQKIGQGGFGSVYSGKLRDGKDVAVKLLSSSSRQGVREFLNEIHLLSRVNHKNLVSLLGYCNDTRELMLVYEHMSGGSLNEHLYGSLANCSNLDWKTRLRIALDASEGLQYLHISCTPKIIHRDVKSSNILLDSNMRAKVADFGLSRIIGDDRVSHVTTAVKGTIGYLDPEYFHTNQLTERSDIYSFGVVLLEIICGRKPIDPDLCEEERNIVKWVMLHVEDSDSSSSGLADIIDKKLNMSEDDMKSFYTMITLSVKCIQNEASKRPSISEIVSDIRDATDLIQSEEVTEKPIEPAYSGDYSSSILHVGR